MASCAHPEERVDPMCDDDDDSNASGDEVQTPSSRNKNKRKETNEAGSSNKARHGCGNISPKRKKIRT